MVKVRGTYVGTVPVAGTGRIGFASTSTGGDRIAGDELYIIATATDTTVSAVPTFGSDPAGWTKLADESGGVRTRHALYVKDSDGTEGNVDVTATGSGTIAVAVAAVSVTAGTRDTSILGNSGISNSTWNTADVTTEVEHSTVLAFLGARSNGSFTPTDCIEHVDTAGGTTTARVAVMEQLTKDPSTRDLEGTTSGTTTESWGFVLVFEPDGHTFSDDFNRTAEDPLDDADQWWQFAGLSVQQVLTNGTQALGFSSGASSNAAFRATVFERDYEMQATIATKGATGDLFSIFLRIDRPYSGTFNAIECRWTVSAGTDTIQFFRWVSGSATQIGTTQNLELANGDKIKFKAVGTHYSVEIDSGSGFSELYAFDDTGSVVTRGFPGFRCGGTTQRIDDVSGNRLVPETAEYVHAVTSGGSATTASTTNINLPIAYPGDVYILNVRTLKTAAGNIAVTIPGFTEFGSYVNGDHEHFIFTRVCDGTEGAVDTTGIVKVATATGTNASSTRWRIGAITVICDSANPFQVDPFNENEEASSTTWQTDTISQTAGDLLVVWVCHDGLNTNSSTSDDAAAVETQDSASNSSGTHVAVYIKRITSTGSANMTGTLSGANAKRTFIYTVKADVPDIFEDADTITLTLTPTLVEEYVSAEDTGTIRVALTPSATELAGYVDSGTISLALTPSFSEEVISFVDEVATTEAQGSTFVADLPTYAAGDLVIFQYTTFHPFGQTNIAPTATDWTVDTGATGPVRHHVAYKIMDGTEGSTVTFTLTGTSPASTWNLVRAASYRGTHQADPVGPITRDDPITTAATDLSAITGDDGDRLIGLLTNYNTGSTANAFTGDAGVNERWDYLVNDFNLAFLDKQPAVGGSYSIGGDYASAPLGHTTYGMTFYLLAPTSAATIEDSGTILLDLTPSFVEEYISPSTILDSGTIYLILTPSGTEYIHVCMPRFRGTLLSWLYDPDAMTTSWYGGLLIPDWHGELLEVEAVVNYAC